MKPKNCSKGFLGSIVGIKEAGQHFALKKWFLGTDFNAFHTLIPKKLNFFIELIEELIFFSFNYLLGAWNTSQLCLIRKYNNEKVCRNLKISTVNRQN